MIKIIILIETCGLLSVDQTNIYSKSIIKLDLDNNFIQEYASINRAAFENNINRSNLRSHIKNGIPKTVGGYVWKLKAKGSNE